MGKIERLLVTSEEKTALIEGLNLSKAQKESLKTLCREKAAAVEIKLFENQIHPAEFEMNLNTTDFIIRLVHLRDPNRPDVASFIIGNNETMVLNLYSLLRIKKDSFEQAQLN